MRCWPEISFRLSNNEAIPKEKGKVNFLPETTDSAAALNFARCTRVLRKLDTCPGEKPASNMSTMQNSSTASRSCNTREPLWAEDFIDLSEFCQPSTIPTKMEDSVDERITSPINNTVCNHSFDYALEGNEGLDGNLEDPLWCIPSPIAMQEELCDPISDWLAATKETNHNDNPSSQTETSYDINEAFLNPRLMTVPSSPQYAKKSIGYTIDDPRTRVPPIDPAIYHSDAAMFNSNPRNVNLSENHLLLNKSDSSLRLPPADSLFKEKKINTAYELLNRGQLLKRKAEVPGLSRVPVNKNVSFPCGIQSPSISQSNIKQEDELPASGNLCSIDGPEMLQPLVSKNADFDLVSYVFEENKPSVSFDIANLRESSPNTKLDTASGMGTRNNYAGSQSVTIKTEPKEEPNTNSDDRNEISYPKRRYEKDKDDHGNSKRLRRYSNCSSEDLTQLESEKYRELRNKNNEASRRSRANRKSREVEMREHAFKLEAENRRLKVKAEEMEKLVKRLRDCLMQLVLKRR